MTTPRPAFEALTPALVGSTLDHADHYHWEDA